MFSKSRQHLVDSNCSYFEHLKFAVVAGARLIWAGVASLVHAIIPQFFPGTAAFTVIDLYKERLENHPNPIYQDKIKEK
jgi:hypothetical protein